MPACQKALEGYHQEGNVKMIAALREQLQHAAEYKGRWWEEPEPTKA